MTVEGSEASAGSDWRTRPAALVERDDAMDLLGRLLTECSEGQGGTVILHAGAGLGKTRLLHAVRAEAAARGYSVLSAIASAEEQAFPYAIMEQLIHVAKITCGYHGPQPQFPDHTVQGTDSFQGISPAVLRTAHQVMIELSARGPLFVSIDDVQYADRPSLQCLLYLIRRCSWTPVVIVITHGTTAGQAFLADLVGIPHVLHIQATALSREGVAELISETVGEVSPRLASAYYSATGGNPLLLRALLDEHATHGEPEVSPGLQLAGGDLFQRAALTCVRRCGPDALGVARSLAVLDGSEPAAILSELSELTSHATATAAAALTDAKLLRGGRFRHPAIQRAMLDDLSSAEGMRLHYRAARLLRDKGECSALVARHLLAAGPIREAWVTPVLQEAAERSLAEDHVSLAARYLQFADICCDDERQRHVIRAALAKTTWRDRPEASARQLQALADPARAGELPGHVSLDVVRRLLWCGRNPGCRRNSAADEFRRPGRGPAVDIRDAGPPELASLHVPQDAQGSWRVAGRVHPAEAAAGTRHRSSPLGGRRIAVVGAFAWRQ